MDNELDSGARRRLAPWKGVVVDWVCGHWPDLTNRQLALLMIVAIEPGHHFVRDLARRLAVPKSIISRILDRLVELGFVVRCAERRDRRDVFATPTALAIEFLGDFDQSIGSHLRAAEPAVTYGRRRSDDAREQVNA